MIQNILPTHIIGRHLQADLPELSDFDGICALCGCPGGRGLPLNKAIGDTFADIDYLTGGRHVCRFCLLCLGKGQGRREWVKNYNMVATHNYMVRPTRDELWGWLLDPPKEKFVFNVTFSHKKHMSFKSRVNMGGSPYFVTTDVETCFVDLAVLDEAVQVMQRWYTVRPGTKDAPWFTKAEILQGTANISRIQSYGVDDFRREDQILERHRGSHALAVLVHALNKSTGEHDD